MCRFAQLTIALTLAVVGGVVGLMSVAAAQPGAASGAAANYQGLWWNAPAGSESGWGINFAHQADTIFATWFTYDTTGYAWWLSMTANKTAVGTYSGTLLRTSGPAFDAIPFDPAKVTRTPVGSGTLSFSDATSGQFSYTVEGVQQTKTLTRQVFGPQPNCAWSAQPNLAGASNYQDLWWVANGAESGWGVNLTHQGDIIFATWFTYDFDGSVLWLSATTPKVDTGLYNGALYRTTGPPFNAQPFDPNRVTRTPVGTLTIKFSDGNTGTFAYSMYGVPQTKPITRQVFYAPAATACNNPLAASVAVDVPTSSPWIGELMQLIAVARDASGYVIPGKAASWVSSAPRVASVSSTGVVQPQTTGTVLITATIDGVSDTKTLTVTPMPRISVTVGSTKEVVYRWATDRCNDQDTPDLPTHIVRGEDGSLVLFAGNAPRSYVSRGADFNSLKRDCSQPALASADRRTPESYENMEWISAAYREGNRWHAFISNEFHDAIAATCDPGNPAPGNPCWYNSVTYAISTDGARTFVKPMAPAHVVAPPPNVWVPPSPGERPNMGGWSFFEGYTGLFSIVRNSDGFYYGVVSPTPSKSEPPTYQNCTVRTDNLGDPASWRAWDGTGFGFRIVSPYVLGGPAPSCRTSHDHSGLITFNSYFNRFMDLGNYRRNAIGGTPVCGLYFSLSTDLLHWSAYQLITEIRDDGWCPFDPQKPGLLEPVPVMYPTVIDHADTTINFERPGRTPYLYYVRYNRGTSSDPLYWLDRDLVRVPLTFTRID